jgi:hypothetical protein
MPTITPNPKKALFLAKKQLSELVYDAVNLEGVNYTLPEVQTLLDGVTVGGFSLTKSINKLDLGLPNKSFSKSLLFLNFQASVSLYSDGTQEK